MSHITVEDVLDFLKAAAVLWPAALIGMLPIAGLILIRHLGHPIGPAEGIAFQVMIAIVLTGALLLQRYYPDKDSIGWSIGTGLMLGVMMDVIIAIIFPIVGVTPKTMMLYLMPTGAILTPSAFLAWDHRHRLRAVIGK